MLRLATTGHSKDEGFAFQTFNLLAWPATGGFVSKRFKWTGGWVVGYWLDTAWSVILKEMQSSSVSEIHPKSFGRTELSNV